MELSDEQRKRIVGYLRDVDAALGDFPDQDRHEFVARLRASIQRSLEGTGDQPVADADVDRVIRRLGTPERQAARLARKFQTTEEPAAETLPADAVWLGVCHRVALRLDMPAKLLRVLMVILGLLLPLTPFLVLGYMALYLIMRQEEGDTSPGVNLTGLIKRVVLLGAACVALHLAAVFLTSLGDRLIWRLTEQTVSLEGGWGWLEDNSGALLFWTLLFTMSIAALSAFPVPSKWSETLLKTAQAIVAVYAFLLCFGMGCYVAGTLLELADVIRITTDLPSLL